LNFEQRNSEISKSLLKSNNEATRLETELEQVTNQSHKIKFQLGENETHLQKSNDHIS